MFPTFTGNSRRTRNVNLSGQKTNPFAGTSWTPSSAAGGTSKSVAEAQAERRQRQQERDRLRAAQQIQRTWRGHRERRNLRDSRRRTFDELYGDSSVPVHEQRLLRAFPLLLATFNAGRRDDYQRDDYQRDDYQRLSLFAEELQQTDYSVVASGKIPHARLKRLVRIVTAALKRTEAPEAHPAFLVLLMRLIEKCPQVVSDELGQYYTTLARLCVVQNGVGWEPDSLRHRAIVLPLAPEVDPNGAFTKIAYRAFAVSFLTALDTGLSNQTAAGLAQCIDAERLSSTVLDAYSSGAVAGLSSEKLLWLLANFIAIQQALPASARSSTYAKALYIQLSTLSADVRNDLGGGGPTLGGSRESGAERPSLPRYVATQLSSLVERKEISNLLDKFTFNSAGSSSQAGEDASMLAGYILTLIRCFQSRGDDIRMRLYLADVSVQSHKMPSLRFFWQAVMGTTVFSRILSNERATLNFLLQRTYFKPASSIAADSVWDREWRTVLLFLELYVFVLRLTDDEDFFSAFSGGITGEAPSSRLASCSLPLEDVKNLSLFLRNLGFTLHNNTADLLRDKGTGEKMTTSLDEIVSLSSTSGRGGKRKPQDGRSATFNVISGIDFEAFRKIVTTALHMLYERDSRRPFLPQGHWLMTSRFDMDGFLSAVVLEEQRQHELRELGSDEDDSGDEDEEMEGYSHPTFTWAGQRRSRYAMMEQQQARWKKQQRDQTLASIGPKLEILRNMPFVIPFETRVQIFRQFVHLDQQRRRGGNIDPDQWRSFVLQQNGGSFDNTPGRGILGRHHAKIRRGNVFNDAYDQFFGLGEGLKEPIQITFVDQFDTVEAGIDGGGVTKEFLTSVTMEAFTSEQHSLFVTNKSNALYPNPSAFDSLQESLRRMGLTENSEDWAEQVQTLTEQYEFLGRIVGKCLYEGILIDIVFAGFFLLKWASSATDSGYRASINDVREMDEELYQGLLQLKNLKDDVSQLELDFTINDQVSLPGESTVTLTRNLIPNGKDVTVTNENRPLYISYVARHRLVAQPYQQTRAFLRGLGAIIDPSWLSMFNQTELQRLVGGDSSEIDVEDLRRNTVYSGVYQIGDDGQEHPTVQLFWQAMREFRDSERRDVLKYVTSTPRAPLLGFSQLMPQFSIRDGGADPDRLPSSSTCVNLLKLPRYPTLEILKNKLRYAISFNAGFDLS